MQINQTVRHALGTGTIFRPDWIPTGIWPEVDEVAAAHVAAVDAYQEAVATAPTQPSLADYNRACEAAIRACEPLPEPEPSPSTAEIEAGRVRVDATQRRVLETAQAVINLCDRHGTTLANAPALAEPIHALDTRIHELHRELNAARREKARYERIPLWLKTNARRPWIDPNPEHYDISNAGNVTVTTLTDLAAGKR